MSVEKTYQTYVTCKYIHVTIVIAPMICDDTMILFSVVFLSFNFLKILVIKNIIICKINKERKTCFYVLFVLEHLEMLHFEGHLYICKALNPQS